MRDRFRHLLDELERVRAHLRAARDVYRADIEALPSSPTWALPLLRRWMMPSLGSTRTYAPKRTGLNTNST